MAGQDRTPSAAVALWEALQREPYAFDFFQVLRRLECLHPRKPRVGQSLRAADDPVRLGQEPSLAFAPATISAFQPGREGRLPRLSVLFLGLFGPNGPLPLHLTEYARDRLRNHDDPTLARFADLFHHRILSLFYRAWAAGQPTANFDRPDADRFALYVGALAGYGLPALRDRDAFPDRAKLHYAGRLAVSTRNAEGLEAMLSGFFGMPVRVEEFIGEWIELPERSRWRLGDSPATGSLGDTIVLGSRMWNCQQKFRLVFGPLGYEDYQRLLPGSESLSRLTALVRNYMGDELEWDVNVILKKEEVPCVQLGASGRLGLTTWLASEPPAHDVADLYLNPLAETA